MISQSSQSEEYLEFNQAVKEANIDKLRILIEKAVDQESIDKMIHDNDNGAFILAAGNGFIEVLKFLIDHTIDEGLRNNMIHARNDLSFACAAGNGYIDVLKFLIDHTIDEGLRNNMIHAQGDVAFLYASLNSHIGVLKLLLEITPNEELRNNMIHTQNEMAFLYAAQKGNVEVLNFLIENTPNEVLKNNMIHLLNDIAFKYALDNTNEEVLTLLIKNTNNITLRKKMIHTQDDLAFKCFGKGVKRLYLICCDPLYNWDKLVEDKFEIFNFNFGDMKTIRILAFIGDVFNAINVDRIASLKNFVISGKFLFSKDFTQEAEDDSLPSITKLPVDILLKIALHLGEVREEHYAELVSFIYSLDTNTQNSDNNNLPENNDFTKLSSFVDRYFKNINNFMIANNNNCDTQDNLDSNAYLSGESEL